MKTVIVHEYRRISKEWENIETVDDINLARRVDLWHDSTSIQGTRSDFASTISHIQLDDEAPTEIWHFGHGKKHGQGYLE